MEVEADDVAFRNIAVVQNGLSGVIWLRYIAFVRRRSFRLLLQALPGHFVQNVGTGGGGALAVEELVQVSKLDTDSPKLLPGSVVHTERR